MKVLSCPLCGGTVAYDEAKNYYICEYCDSVINTETAKDERVQQMKERANRLFLSCDFEGAYALYQNVVSECTEDAEAYWLLAMCAYGIQYVDDPLTGKKIPTCNRTLYTSILNNEDYLNALDCADPECREYYEKTAKQIDEIQKEILEIVAKEEAYDIFLSYKESDENGRRTKEGELAMDLYYKLTANNYRVFYAPETLNKKVGQKYEPYIFAALNSARMMICIGFSSKHFNAPWVKNEWSRFLARKARNPRLILLTCYNSYLMNGSDIPEMLAKTQAVDMAKNSPNDLLHEVSKMLPNNTEKAPEVAASNVQVVGNNANALCKRGYVYLEDGQFQEASSYFNKSLDQNPELSKAYWGLLLASLKCCNNGQMLALGKPITGTNEYKKAIRFGSGAEQDEYLEMASQIDKKIQTCLNQLTQKQAEVLKNTNIFSELTIQKKELEEQKTIIEKHLAELAATEKDIQHAIEMCDKVLKPYLDSTAAATREINKLQNNTRNSTTYTNAEFREITNTMDALRKELTNTTENLNKIKRDEPCFVQLTRNLQRQRELKNLLDQDGEKQNQIQAKMRYNYDHLNAILNEFKPSWDEVKQGNYERYKKLMAK